MAKEIKFRAWDEKAHKMLDGATMAQIAMLGYNTLGANDKYMELRMGGIPDRPIHLMQYTGLKDKNGVEVFEGDIYQCDNPNHAPHKVGWDIYNDTDYNQCVSGFPMCGHEYEVIGNIYSNPELLEEAKQ